MILPTILVFATWMDRQPAPIAVAPSQAEGLLREWIAAINTQDAEMMRGFAIKSCINNMPPSHRMMRWSFVFARQGPLRILRVNKVDGNMIQALVATTRYPEGIVIEIVFRESPPKIYQITLPNEKGGIAGHH